MMPTIARLAYASGKAAAAPVAYQSGVGRTVSHLSGWAISLTSFGGWVWGVALYENNVRGGKKTE